MSPGLVAHLGRVKSQNAVAAKSHPDVVPRGHCSVARPLQLLLSSGLLALTAASAQAKVYGSAELSFGDTHLTHTEGFPGMGRSDNEPFDNQVYRFSGNIGYVYNDMPYVQLDVGLGTPTWKIQSVMRALTANQLRCAVDIWVAPFPQASSTACWSLFRTKKA